MNNKLRLYLALCYSIAFLFLIFMFNKFELNTDVNFYYLVFFTLLVIITESFMVPINQITVSTGFAVTLAIFYLFGPIWPLIIIPLGIAFRYTKYNGKFIYFLNTPVYKTLFNVSNMIISISIPTCLFIYSGGSFDNNELNQNIIPIIYFVLTFLFVNTTIISGLVHFLTNDSFKKIYLSYIRMGLLNIIAMAPFGLILIAFYQTNRIIGILFILGPILFARYTFLQYVEAKSKYVQTVQALMHAMEARDKYTEGHSRRVAQIVDIIARELRYREGALEQLRIASFLHDVGKIGIDDNILNKPGKLTNEEYRTIQQHPEIGYNILKDIKDLEHISFIVRYHHERYDGKGYPCGKKPSELNLDVFIVQLADSIDAMATDRPYRKALTQEDIINEVVKNKGTQFHPDVVDAYLNAVRKNIL